MNISNSQCNILKTNREKYWPYIESYAGEKDEDLRKNGKGENHWSGAKSLESYSGDFVCDTMHGEGDYRWRFYGPQGTFATYEGHFFNNQLHGYGTVSYNDGRVFSGIFHVNIRWGPGVESHACVKEDVGIWRGTQLIRLCWRPDGPSVTPDLMSAIVGRDIVKSHRNILTSTSKTLGEVNNALELLKHYGANPLSAIEKSVKLYPKHCTDLCSALCHTEMFDHKYYMGKINTLEENMEVTENREVTSSDDEQEFGAYYAWNNNYVMKHIMKHCYKHENQRKILGPNIASILSGPRNIFKPAGQHELDCRTLLMASYLGHIVTVAELINENKIHPDVADIQGNTALMYATCGENADVIHFLVEAGANINSFNDSCCTPLGVALIKLTCAEHDVPQNGTLQALLPSYYAPAPSLNEQYICEWAISREHQSPNASPTLTKSPSKNNKNLSSKRIKSLQSLKDQPGGKKKSEVVNLKGPDKTSEESFLEDKSLYSDVVREYIIKVDDIFYVADQTPLLYLFEVNDMSKEIDANEDDHKKVPDKNPKKVISRVLREATKPSKDAMWLSVKDENKSIDCVEKQKREQLKRIMNTVIQLLSYGADPKIVKCPHRALFLAITSGSLEAVKHLISHGAKVNEVYPEVLDYTALDIAVSRPFTYDNLEIIKLLLERNADTQHRLMYELQDGMASEILGPTLLHAVLARRTETETEEQIRREILELLLDYNCNPITQFKGRSAIDISMSKSMDIFDIFIRNSKTNLNYVINDVNQSVLVKMFYLPFFKTIVGTERLQKITDLLLFGANPLIECQNGEEEFGNLFVFVQKILSDLEGNQTKLAPMGTASKQEPKNKKVEKSKKDDKIATKSMGKMTDDLGDYKQAIELVTECARLLHIRWIQAKLVKELIDIIKKYSHRHWNMILKEIKFKKNIGLWLLPQRCLEIWHILANAKRRHYSDRHILKHLLNIVQFCTSRVMNQISLNKSLTAVEKGNVEKLNYTLLHDYKSSETEVLWKRCYVKPELIRSDAKMFNVCFECASPLLEDKIRCVSCKLLYFCSLNCIKCNIERVNCHPCSQILRDKYFPESSNIDIDF